MKVSITMRVPIRPPEARKIADYARSKGAHASPVLDLDGRIDEMLVKQNGLIKGTIFGHPGGGLGVWINSKTQEGCDTAFQAVDRVLQGLTG